MFRVPGSMWSMFECLSVRTFELSFLIRHFFFLNNNCKFDNVTEFNLHGENSLLAEPGFRFKKDLLTDLLYKVIPKQMITLRLLLRFLIPVLPLLVSFQVNAQTPARLRSVLSFGGSSAVVTADGHRYYLQQSIGQPGITGLLQNNNLQLRQGFIQPLAISLKVNSTGTIQATIFPNPFSDNIIISFAEEMTEPLYITLYDLNGRIVRFEKLGASPELFLDAGNLAPGAYFLRVNTTTKYFHSKIFKH